MKEKHKLERREKLKKASPTVMGYIERRQRATQNQLPKHLRPLPAYPIYIQIALNVGVIVTLAWLMMSRDDFMTEAAPALGMVLCLLVLIYTLTTAFQLKRRYHSTRLRRWTVFNLWLMGLAGLMFPVSVAYFLP